jgi:N6-adenosine-specific RNA methylase IME4
VSELAQIRPAQIRSGKLLEVARRALVEADELPDIAALVDRAEVVRVAARKAKLSLHAQNDWAEFKLDAQRKAGRMLAEMDRHRAEDGRPTKASTDTRLSDLGISWDQSSKWQRIGALPDAAYEQFKEERRQAEDEITEVALLRVARNLEAERRTARPPVLPPLGRYRVLSIDPPWPIEKIEREERPNQAPSLDYPTMSLEEIGALPVPDLADPAGCHIYLWVTHRFLPAGLDLLDRWGVRYQCVMTWVKNVGITPFSWMYSTEHVLFGRIGSLPLDQLGLRLDFAAPVQGHSRKPDAFYERACQASPGPRLAMFERGERAGFEVWGDEVSADADLAG